MEIRRQPDHSHLHCAEVLAPSNSPEEALRAKVHERHALAAAQLEPVLHRVAHQPHRMVLDTLRTLVKAIAHDRLPLCSPAPIVWSAEIVGREVRRHGRRVRTFASVS